MSSDQTFKWLALAALLGAAIVTQPTVNAKEPPPPPNGAAVFKQQCASCHAGGGNTVTPGKPLAGSTKLESLALFKDYLRSPLGHMPYYKNVVDDKQTLKALFDYCKTLKPSKQA